MPVSVLTQHNDNIRSGANLQETKLNTTNVNVNDFGLLASRDVEGQIYAQPLYVPGIEIAGKARNVVYVVTMHNWVPGLFGNGKSILILSRPASTA